LIGRFGHSNQEIVNLVLFGKATSNVFDGDKDLGDGMILHGVPLRVSDDDAGLPIGLLSELESLRYVTVGDRLKNPKFPVWLIGSPSHYTLLFGFDSAVVAQVSDSDMKTKQVFVSHQLDDGIVMGDGVGKIAQELELSEQEREELQSLVKEDVLLLDEYMDWIRKRRSDGNEQEIKRGRVVSDTRYREKNESFDLLFIDGQVPVSLVDVTISKMPIPVPTGVIDYGDNLRPALVTKWKEYQYIRALKKF
jgi:hypothetical protein